MQLHPEGGYFSEVFRSEEFLTKEVLPKRFSGNRNFYTSIYFLLTSGQYSKFHRLKADEIWHFYSGSPMKIIILKNQDNIKEMLLGPDIENGERFQQLIPAGNLYNLSKFREK